jgi:hypothetical protein
MPTSFDAAQRRALVDAAREGRVPPCPACGGRLDAHEVPRPPGVAYVRHRRLLVCRDCGRGAAVDVVTWPKGG